VCVCVCVRLCVCPIFCPRFLLKLNKPLLRPGGPQVIVHWSKERVRVDDVYSVVKLGPKSGPSGVPALHGNTYSDKVRLY
jgi:hypothetical protein